MKGLNKKLIYKQLSVFCLVVFTGYLALQIFFHPVAKPEKQTASSQSEWVLAVSHHAPAADLTPDLKFIQDWFRHDHLVFVFGSSAVFRFGTGAYCLVNSELIRFLRASICINAP
jgi:hypothetical protein